MTTRPTASSQQPSRLETALQDVFPPIKKRSNEHHLMSIVIQLFHQSTNSTVTLSTETVAKYLGVKITSDLWWGSYHWGLQQSQQDPGLPQMQHKTTNERLKNAAYKAFVWPVPEYASPAWDPFTANNIMALERFWGRQQDG